MITGLFAAVVDGRAVTVPYSRVMAAQLLLEMSEEDGDAVPESVRALANAQPVSDRDLTEDELPGSGVVVERLHDAASPAPQFVVGGEVLSLVSSELLWGEAMERFGEVSHIRSESPHILLMDLRAVTTLTGSRTADHVAQMTADRLAQITRESRTQLRKTSRTSPFRWMKSRS